MNCPDCGKPLQPDFNYCPGCGIELDKLDQFRQVVEDSFAQLEVVVAGDAILRLESLSSRLDSMEQELDVFLTTAPQRT